MRADKDKTSQSAQGVIDEDLLLQHISALNAKLTVAFEKKIDPLGSQIIAYKEVVAPLSQDLKRNLAQMNPLMQQVQTLESTLTAAIRAFENDKQAVDSEVAALRGEMVSALELLRDTLSPQLTDIKTTIETSGPVLEQVQALAARLDSLETGLTSTIETTVAAVSQLITPDTSGEVKDAIQALQTSIDKVEYSLQSDISSAFSTMLDSNQKLLDGLQEQLVGAADPEADGPDESQEDLADGLTELRELVQSSLGRIEMMQAEHNGAQVAAFESAKNSLQSDVSGAFSTWLETNQALLDKFDALNERLSSLAEEAPARDLVAEPPETVYQPVTEPLPDILRERVDEVHSRLTNSDWAIQSIGKNLTSLMHEVSGMRDDVLSASMARRTYNAVEDIRVLLDEITRGTKQQPQAVELAEQLEKTLESVRSTVLARPDDLASTVEQLSQSIASHSQQLSQTVEQKIQDIVLGNSQSMRTIASIESAALQKLNWNKKFTGARPKPLAGYDGADALGQLKADNPVTFERWYAAFQNGAVCYTEARSSNCSTLGNAMARCFRDYLSLFANGAILDIGCGPYGDPAYLTGIPDSQLTGLEPLDILNEKRFPIVRGVNEFLPWADHSFDTIVNATSLDHVLDLEKSLSETHRALKSDGVYVIWYADVEGAENVPAKPPSKQIAVDKHHLFHISEAWFGDVIGKWFELVDYRRVATYGTVSDVFAAYRPLPNPVRNTTNKTTSAASPKKRPTAAAKAKRKSSSGGTGKTRKKV